MLLSLIKSSIDRSTHIRSKLWFLFILFICACVCVWKEFMIRFRLIQCVCVCFRSWFFFIFQKTKTKKIKLEIQYSILIIWYYSDEYEQKKNHYHHLINGLLNKKKWINPNRSNVFNAIIMLWCDSHFDYIQTHKSLHHGSIYIHSGKNKNKKWIIRSCFLIGCRLTDKFIKWRSLIMEK